MSIIGLPEHTMYENGDVFSSDKRVPCRYGGTRFSKKTKLVTSVDHNGYYHGTATHYGKHKGFLVHRVLAMLFITNPNKYPCVNHKDGDKLNNSLDNLEWCTVSQNIRHAYRMGLSRIYTGNSSKSRKLTSSTALEIYNLYQDGNLTTAEIGKKYGVSATTVSDIAKGKTWNNKKLSITEIENYAASLKIVTVKELINHLKNDYGTGI